MKKVLAVLCAVFFLCSPLTVLAQADAEGSSYQFGSIGVGLTFSEKDWYILTRENLKGNQFFTDFKQDEKEFQTLFEENDIYFDAFSPDAKYEIVMTSSFVGFPQDLYHLTGDDADETIRNLLNLEEMKQAGVAVQDYSLVEIGEHIFLWMDFSRKDQTGTRTLYGRQYTTIAYGELTNFTLTSYSGESIESSVSSVLHSLLVSTTYFERDSAYWELVLAWIPPILMVGAIVAIVLWYRRTKKEKELEVERLMKGQSDQSN